MQRKQRIVGHDNHRFEKKLLVMPDRCAAYGCNNKADPESGIEKKNRIPNSRRSGLPNYAENTTWGGGVLLFFTFHLL